MSESLRDMILRMVNREEGTGKGIELGFWALKGKNPQMEGIDQKRDVITGTALVFRITVGRMFYLKRSPFLKAQNGKGVYT